jgi:hypothetical protein
MLTSLRIRFVDILLGGEFSLIILQCDLVPTGVAVSSPFFLFLYP